MQKFSFGQISLILSEGKLCPNTEKDLSTEVILTIYVCNSTTNSYHTNGGTVLLKSPKVLHTNVTKHILYNNQEVTLSTGELEELQGYTPFSSDVNIEN